MHPSWRIVDLIGVYLLYLSYTRAPQKHHPHIDRAAPRFSYEVAADGEWLATGGGTQASIWRMPNCTVSSLEAGCDEEAGVSSGDNLGILGFQENPFPRTLDTPVVVLVSRLDLCTFWGPCGGYILYDRYSIQGTLSQD